MGLGEGKKKDRELSGVMIPRQAGFGCHQHHPCTGSTSAEKEHTAESWPNAFHYSVSQNMALDAGVWWETLLIDHFHNIKAPL